MTQPAANASAAPHALTIAATDSSGGAGVTADIRTFAAFGVWPLCAVTAVTAQHPGAVVTVASMDAATVVAQMEAVRAGVGVDAVKTGLLPTPEIVRAVARAIAAWSDPVPLVVDPVVRASTGDDLAGPGVVDALRTDLLAYATAVTPNLAEAGALLGAEAPRSRAEMEEAGRALLELGCGAAIVTGGHLEGECADVIVTRGVRPVWLVAGREEAPGTHGSGCVFSAAITARLAMGDSLETAAQAAKRYVTEAIRSSVALGSGGAVRPS